MIVGAISDLLKCTCKYFVDGSLCHFKCAQVLLAHILGEVCTFCVVLLNVPSRACLAIFIEISVYLTDTEQRIC